MEKLENPQNIEQHQVVVPEKQVPLRIAGIGTGKMRDTKLGDYPEVWEHACKLKACFIDSQEIHNDLLRRFGLNVPTSTINAMEKAQKYSPLIIRHRKSHAVTKLREIPYAYPFKRLEKLSEAMELATDARDIALLDESLRREMAGKEQLLLDVDVGEEMTPDEKKKLLLLTAIRLLRDPRLTTWRIEAEILKAARTVERLRVLRKKVGYGNPINWEEEDKCNPISESNVQDAEAEIVEESSSEAQEEGKNQ